jgi:hypothetical protein
LNQLKLVREDTRGLWATLLIAVRVSLVGGGRSGNRGVGEVAFCGRGEPEQPAAHSGARAWWDKGVANSLQRPALVIKFVDAGNERVFG